MVGVEEYYGRADNIAQSRHLGRRLSLYLHHHHCLSLKLEEVYFPVCVYHFRYLLALVLDSFSDRCSHEKVSNFFFF